MADRTASVSGLWSSAATWGGSAPPADLQTWTINNGVTVTFDADLSALANGLGKGTIGTSLNSTAVLQVDGSVDAARYLKMADDITGYGTLQLGTVGAPVRMYNNTGTPGFALEFAAGKSVNDANLTTYNNGAIRALFAEVTSCTDTTHFSIDKDTEYTAGCGPMVLYPGDIVTITNSWVVGATATRHKVASFDPATGAVVLSGDTSEPMTSMALSASLNVSNARGNGTGNTVLLGTKANPTGGTGGMVDAVMLDSRPITVFTRKLLGSPDSVAAFKACKPTAFIIDGVRIYGKNAPVATTPSDNAVAGTGSPIRCVFQNGTAMYGGSNMMPALTRFNQCIFDQAAMTANALYSARIYNSIVINAAGYGLNSVHAYAENSRMYNNAYGAFYYASTAKDCIVGGQGGIGGVYGQTYINCKLPRMSGINACLDMLFVDCQIGPLLGASVVLYQTANIRFARCRMLNSSGTVPSVANTQSAPISDSRSNRPHHYTESFDHNQPIGSGQSGAYASWTMGGYCEKVATDNPDGKAYHYLVTCTDTSNTYNAFYQRKYTLQPNETIYIRAYVRGYTAWTAGKKPNVRIFAENADPLMDAANTYLASYDPPSSVDWQNSVISYTNPSTSLPLVIVVRCQAIKDGSNVDAGFYIERLTKAGPPRTGETIMAIKGQACALTFCAWDTILQQPKTGDKANFIMRWVKDGTPSAITNDRITEVDSANTPGVYKIAMSSDEMTMESGTFAGTSTTPGVVIIPVQVFTDAGKLTAQGGAISDLTLAIAGPGGIADDTNALLTGQQVITNRIGSPETSLNASINELNIPSAATIAAAVWGYSLTLMTVANSIGKKLKDWILGSDNKVLLSTNEQTGVTIPTVTEVANSQDVDLTGIPAAVWANTERTLTSLETAESGIVATLDYTVLYPDVPYVGAYVRCYSSAARTTLLKHGKTNSLGVVSFGFTAEQMALLTDDKVYINVDIVNEATQTDAEVATWLA